MPSGCAALPAKKKTTDAEGPCIRLAQSYHAFGDSAPAKAEISGLMERWPMLAESRHAGPSPMTSRTFSRAAR